MLSALGEVRGFLKCYPPAGYAIFVAYPKGGAMMSDVQMISVLIAFVVICFKKSDTFISIFEIKASAKSFKVKISTKQKNGSPRKNDRS